MALKNAQGGSKRRVLDAKIAPPEQVPLPTYEPPPSMMPLSSEIVTTSLPTPMPGMQIKAEDNDYDISGGRDRGETIDLRNAPAETPEFKETMYSQAPPLST